MRLQHRVTDAALCQIQVLETSDRGAVHRTPRGKGLLDHGVCVSCTSPLMAMRAVLGKLQVELEGAIYPDL